MNVSINQLRAFVAVSRYGSFTLAAEALHRTQPAVTMLIRQLEDSLSLKLFDRTTRQLKLTTIGLEFVTAASEMLRQLDSVVGMAQDIRNIRAGLVRIGCLPSVAATFLPLRIAQFREQHPGISFSLHDALGSKVIAMVKSGEVEYGITDVKSEDTDLQSTHLLEEHMCVLYLQGHPLDHTRDVSIEELAKHNLILMATGSNARRIVDLAFAKQGRVAVPTCEAVYMSTAVGMVQAGLGVALLPSAGIQLNIDPRLKVRSVDAPGFKRKIALVRLKKKTLSPAAEAFAMLLANKSRCSTTSFLKGSSLWE